MNGEPTNTEILEAMVEMHQDLVARIETRASTQDLGHLGNRVEVLTDAIAHHGLLLRTLWNVYETHREHPPGRAA